jgi:two-component system cell cycle sensor histidine kinase/response regulator CckA
MHGRRTKAWKETVLRVLLVDDEDNLRRLLVKLLKSRQFEVVEFSNSPDALAWSEKNEFDVLVTDVCLEHIDGRALGQAIAKRNPDLLVVYISGFPLDIHAERQAHPHCAYLQKPFPPRALLTTITELDEQRPGRHDA